MTAIRTEPIADASVWHGRDLAANRRWEHWLDDRDLQELHDALQLAKSRELGVPSTGPEEFPLPGLSGKLASIGAELKDGRGFALLRGFPVERYSIDDLELMYWGLCSHIGTGLTQNGDAGFIHYVTVGKRRPSQGTRGVGFPTVSRLHVDLMDIVSLLCVRPAPDDLSLIHI